MKKLDTYKAFFLLLLIAAAGGGVAVLSKVALQEISPVNFTLTRLALALVILLPIFYFRGEKLTLSSFRKLFWVSLFGAGNIIIFIFGIRLTNASSSQIIYTLSPLFAGVLSYFFLKERLGKLNILGVIIGFLGTLFIVLLPVIKSESGLNGGLAGNLLILLAVFSHSLYSVFSKRKHNEFSPIALTVHFVAFTFIIQFLIFLFSGGFGSLEVPSLKTALCIMYVGAIGTGAYYLLYQYAIKRSSPTVASSVLYLQPIFTIFWAMWLLGEQITWPFLLGSLLAIIGVALTTVKSGKKDLGYSSSSEITEAI